MIKLNVPEDVFGETICHLKLSAEPDTSEPDISVPVLFIIAPSDSVSKTNTLVGVGDTELGIWDEVAGSQFELPLTTLVTNSETPPFWN
jgi:hypothetical protein